MVELFEDDPARGHSAHDDFQSWRRANEDGFVLYFRTRTRANLHRNSRCSHPGDATWTVAENSGASLTSNLKACSPDLKELTKWAEDRGVLWRWCYHCERSNARGTTVQYDQPAAVELADARPLPPTAASTQGMTPRVVEGLSREIKVMASSRSRELRAVALEQSGGVCEACGIDFSAVLGGLGLRALQVHHRTQLRLLDEPVLNTIEDVAVVCANCHAMIHADPLAALPVESLSAMWRAR